MRSVIKTVTFDAADALVLARFWAAVFGSDVDEESTSDKAYLEAAGWGGPNIWFARVLERHQHYVVMQDPEGNEFCVEPGPADPPE